MVRDVSELAAAVEWRRIFADMVREEKMKSKQRLREALAAGNYSYVYHYVLFSHPRHVRAQTNFLAYGVGVEYIDESYVTWVLRYFRRLTGKALNEI